jgi:hypothetical protein
MYQNGQNKYKFASPLLHQFLFFGNLNYQNAYFVVL